MSFALLDYQAPPDLLAGRVILVTGAGDGIGRAAARAYAAHGATVILAGRTLAKLEAVYDQIVADGHPEPVIHPIDLKGATRDDYWTMHHSIDQHFGRLDGLLHNAAQLGQRTPIEQYNTDTWLEVMQVNVNAVFMLTQAMLPLMRAAHHASLILTSSAVGRRGRAYWGAYAVSKFAVEGLMQTLADELDSTSTVRVNTLNPGATRTNMRMSAYPGEAADANPTPEEIMPAYLWLMGRDSHGVHGQALDAHGLRP